MRKMLMIALAGGLIFVLSACSSTEPEITNTSSSVSKEDLWYKNLREAGWVLGAHAFEKAANYCNMAKDELESRLVLALGNSVSLENMERNHLSPEKAVKTYISSTRKLAC